MPTEMIMNILPSLLAVVGVYVKIMSDMEKLKTQVQSLQEEKTTLTEKMDKMMDKLQKIELLLAKNQVQ